MIKDLLKIPDFLRRKKRRGRPRKIKKAPKSAMEHKGVRFVARKASPQSNTHRWIAVFNNEVIGYYKTPEDAAKAYNENRKTNSK